MNQLPSLKCTLSCNWETQLHTFGTNCPGWLYFGSVSILFVDWWPFIDLKFRISTTSHQMLAASIYIWLGLSKHELLFSSSWRCNWCCSCSSPCPVADDVPIPISVSVAIFFLYYIALFHRLTVWNGCFFSRNHYFFLFKIYF